ncbi:hypothetical protein [Rhodoferax sp.]|uniref:hypothetical protein n=1 Tax=Rhodoferax sp. TaxID=50421 RepID=UPI00374D0B73
MKPTQALTTPAKKEAYMSMDRDERDILRTLGLRERALYPELKWLASFKTGEVQHFGKRVITFQFLADLITVPTTQGRAADTMNAKEACRVLMKLHDAGLVGEIENHPTKGLRFALPLSPICKKSAHKLRHEAKAQEKSGPEKLPNDAPAETSENPIAMRASEESASSLSVMMISEGEQYDFHTDISNLAAVHGTAAARDSVAGASLKHLVDASVNELGGATANALTVEVIKGRLRASRSEFSWIDHPESGAMFRRWVAAEHGAEKFEEAVRAVEADFSIEPTPRAIDSELRGSGARRVAMLRVEQTARRRRGVAL